MSIIKTWSAKEFDEEGDLEGFFELEFEGNSYGYFHTKPLKEGEEGFDLIGRWLEDLLRAVLILKNGQYVAISDIEALYTWIEFERCKDLLKVSVVTSDIDEVTDSIFIQPLPKREYKDWQNVFIVFSDFQKEVVEKTELYIQFLIEINPRLDGSRRVKRIKELLILVKGTQT